MSSGRRYVLVIPDGAADLYRGRNGSPLEAARTDWLDLMAREGECGLMQTLYEDLPKESVVAQLGMLGWDPREHYPHGRSSFELLATGDIELSGQDLAFRANLVRMEGRRLASYNAGLIDTGRARDLVARIREATREEFPDLELYHGSDFRSTLVVRQAATAPGSLICPEPHECEGDEFDLDRLITAKDAAGRRLARRLNRFLTRVAEVLAGAGPANRLWPWNPATVARLPRFADHTGFRGRVVVVGYMDFLEGMARAGAMEFLRVGNGRPDTDYAAKGAAVVQLLAAGVEFVICHVNAPDEAAHMGDLALKIRTIEEIDDKILRPVVTYFRKHPEQLGGVLVAPDHYTNHSAKERRRRRVQAHSLHPVPFSLWTGRARDATRWFGEREARRGRYGRPPVSHLDLLGLLGVSVRELAAEPLGARRSRAGA